MARGVAKWSNRAGRDQAFRSPLRGTIHPAASMPTSQALEVEDRAVAPRAPTAVDIRGASLTFDTADGKVEALSKVDLQIAAGDFVSFIGPSGCGKTTLLRIIADLERLSAGTVAVNGVSPEEARLNR